MKDKLLILFSVVLLVGTQSALAHDAQPLYVAILEQGSGIYRVVVRAPPSLQTGGAPSIRWPDRCDVKKVTPARLTPVNTHLVECDEGLAGETIHLQYPGFNPSITTLFRLQTVDGHTITAILPPDQLMWTVPENPHWQDLAVQYTLLGFAHIWSGLDHLLFVAGLLLLARRPKKIIYAVTGFTLSHSITLSLATFNLVRVPISLAETMIALSVFFLAVEIVRNNSQSFSHRFPIVISFVFGLLHGFGFASILSEFHMAASDVAIGLLFFNVGVELGQLSFIAGVILSLGLLAWINRRASAANLVDNLFTPLSVRVGAYLIGIPAAYWFIERASYTIFS